ncbi:hypothetical protein SAY87_012762 [Trapa incisa]|uniref:non-specific serine/threonine protein kinase n=1 Tax=Trapa incisa TaxID=236973 RepID=A0AAN7GHZ3_9MYRT|nr:hypothetical protein SAY87_012762 [Trapa incisa]
MPTLLPEIGIRFRRGILLSRSPLSFRSTATPLTIYPRTPSTEIALGRSLLVHAVSVCLLTGAGMHSRAASGSGFLLAKYTDVSNSEPEFVEVDPSGRYVRYSEILGKGAFKKVYKAFDEVDGIEVAWNQVKVDDILKTQDDLHKVCLEVHLLKLLKHDNILKFYHGWVDYKKKNINMITELFTSGSLRQYRKKHKNVDMKAIKNWSKQILQGLVYLHNQQPPVIHRDLKCDNIFVNGNHGEVKIGDLGLATVRNQPTARSVIGTPEFMAPELYEEEYNELVDVYSFGMCILEMVTLEYPYSECKNPAQIYKKVTSAIKPAALDKISDPQLRAFIEKCLVPASERLSAKELLDDSFLQIAGPKELAGDTSQLAVQSPILMNLSEPLLMDVDGDSKQLSPQSDMVNDDALSHHPVLDFERVRGHCTFKLRGRKNDENSVSLILQIKDGFGPAENIHFLFYLDSDTALSVASEMAVQLELVRHDVIFISEFIDFMIVKLLPGWKPSDCLSDGALIPPVGVDKIAMVSPSDSMVTSGPAELLVKQVTLESFHSNSSGTGDSLDCAVYQTEGYLSPAPINPGRLDSQQYAVSEIVIEDSSTKHEKSAEFVDFPMNGSLHTSSGTSIGAGNCIPVDEHLMNAGLSLNDVEGQIMSLTTSCSSLSLANKDIDTELKVELDTIEAQYQHWFVELSRMREGALEATKRRWMSKKKLAHN